MSLEVIFGILGTLLLAIIGRAIYGIFLQDTEVQLKGYLARNRSRRRHQRMVDAFVTALNGGAEHHHVRLQMLPIMLLGSILIGVAMVSLTYVNSRQEQARDALRTSAISLAKSKAELAEVEKMLEATINSPRSPRSAAEIVHDEQSAMRSRIDYQKSMVIAAEERQKIVESLLPPVQVMKFSVGVLLAVGCGLLFYFMTAWVPTTIRTRIFAFEATRFANRMQALASPEQMAQLALSEVRVTDELTLRHFIATAASIARKHNAVELAARLDLWGDLTTPESAA